MNESTFRFSSRALSLDMSPIRRLVEAAPPDAIHLGIGQPAERTPAAIVEMARESLEQDPLGYTPNAGLPALRAAIAESSGAAMTAEQVCITAGSQEGLFCAMQTLLDPGDEVILPDPGFPAYTRVAKLAGAKAVLAPLDAKDGFRLHIESIEERIGPRTRAVMICTPSNPLGTVIDRPTIAELSRLCDERGLYLISDEVYRDLYYTPEPPPSPLGLCQNAIVIRALSKSHAMTGWRLGWTLAPREVTQRLILVHAYAITCVASVVQNTALRLFRSGKMDDLSAEARALYRHRKELVLEQLQRHGLHCIPPEGAFYAFVDVSKYGRPTQDMAWDALRQHKVVTIPGSVFGERGEGFCA